MVKNIIICNLCISLVFFIGLMTPNIVFGDWFNSSWNYRQQINISNTAGNLTNYQVRLDLNSSNVGSNFNWSNNGSDIRFTNSTDDELSFWIEDWNSTGQEATIWVNVTSLPNNTNTTIYMYYGNPSASSASDGEATFEFFDDTEQTVGERVIITSWDFNAIGHIIEFKVETPSSDGCADYLSDDNGDVNAANFYVDDGGDGKVKEYDGTMHTIADSYTEPVILVAKLISTSTLDYQVYNPDRTLAGEITGANYRGSPTRIDTLWTGSSSKKNWQTHFHWLFIRKYTSPEPSVSNFGSEETAPAVSFSITLNSPPNQTTTDDSTPDFNFTVSGTESSYSCELFLNDTGYGTATANNNTATIITANQSLLDGTYDWYINCTAGITNQSEVREITINEFPTYSNNSTNSTTAGASIEHRLKWIDNNLSGGGFEFFFCNGYGTDAWCIGETIKILANETAFYNSTGNESEDICQYAISATATEEADDRKAEWATGEPNCTDHCTNWEENCGWGKTDWSHNANLTLTYNTSVYAKNITVYYDEYETINALYLNNSGTWEKVHDGLSNDCPFVKTFPLRDYLTNQVRFESLDDDWAIVDAVQLCGKTVLPYETLEYDNITIGAKYIFFLSDDLQPGWMVDTGVNVSKYIVDNGLAYMPSLSVGDNVSLDYYYTDPDLDAFFDEYYTKPNMEITFQGETGENDEMQNLSYDELNQKLQRMYDVLEDGLGVFYDVNASIAPGCTWNYSSDSLQAYPDNNISMGIYCYFDWMPIYDNWKEESSVSGFYWIPENLVPMFEGEGDSATLRSLSDIQADCIKNLEEKGICMIYFHVQDFQDPINETRYQRLKEVVDWVKNNLTLKEMGVVNNVTLSKWLSIANSSKIEIKNYDDYYNLSNTTAEIIVEGKSANVTNYQIFNASNSSVKNYTMSYFKFYGVDNVNLTFKVGQPITEESNVGYRFDNITITANESKWIKDDFVPFNSSMCNADYTICWSNVTKTVTSSGGKTIYWKVFVNDSSNNWNTSEVFSYITTIESFIRNLTTTLSVILSTDKKSTSYRIFNESVSSYFESSKSETLRKYITEEFFLSSVTKKIENLIKSVDETIFPIFSYSKIQNLMKSISEEFSISTLATRMETLIKSILANIGLSDYTNKESIYFKNPDTEITLSVQNIKNIELNRELTLTATLTPEMIRKLESNRELTISYTISAETMRELNLNRLTTLHLTLTPQLARNIEVSRDNELSLTITPQLFRELVKTGNILTTITITPEVFREINLAKINYLTITLTPELAKELNLTKSAEITIILTPELIRNLQTEKIVEGSIILTPELVRSFEGTRKMTELFQFSGIVERAVSLNRAITQSITSFWTTTYQKLITGYQEVYQTITLTEITERAVDVQKKIEDTASISLISSKFKTLTKSVSDIFTLSTLADRTLILFRLPTDIAVFTESTEKTASFGRLIEDTLTSLWTTTYQKLITGYQEVYQTITLSTTTDRILNIQRSSQNTLTLTLFTTRAKEFIKTIYHTLTLEINVPEIFEPNRRISQNMTTSIQLDRYVSLTRETTTSPIIKLITDRTIELTKKLTETANIQTILKRMFNLFRQPHLEEQITTIIDRKAEYEREPYTNIELSLKSTKKAIIVIVGEYNITIYTKEYAPGDTVYIYAIIPELTRSPPITIYYPNMTELIEDTMTYFENNIFYYTLTAPNTKGDYLVKVTAGNSTAINTFRVSSTYIEGGGVGIEIYTTGDYLYYPGTTAKIPFTIISKTNGEPVDYDSIKITIYSPNMSSIAERTTANKISQGIYYINYNISSLADYGVYPIVINATSGSYYTTRLTSFKVLPAGPLDVSITPLKTEVQQGEDLPVKLRIKNLGEGRTITYTYRIYSANSTYYTETSTLTLNRYEDKQLIKTIPLPITADTGIATLELNVSYSTSEPSIYNTNFVTISYSPRGYTPKILTTTFNLTPEKQYLTILRNNNTIFSGIIHDKDTMQLSEGKYKFIFTAENYFKKTAEIYLDRDLTITSKLSSTFFQIPVLLAGNIYKFILLLLILACILVFFKFIRV